MFNTLYESDSPQCGASGAEHARARLQDANWRELLRFCFVRGAYRGAGADLLRNLTRSGDGGNHSLFGVTDTQDGAQALLNFACLWHDPQEAFRGL